MTVEIREHESGYLLKSQAWLPFGRKEVFAFFADARNLERLTPPWLNFRILSDVERPIHKGMLIDYKLRLRGVPIRWRTEISAWEPSVRFVDSMVRGPYRYWIHEHRFEDKDGGTLMTDEVRYAVPGPEFLHRWLVKPDLERIFGYRRAQLEAALREVRSRAAAEA